MSAPPITRRALLLALLGTLTACATPEAPVATAPPEDPDPDPDPDPEQVYSPGAIPWANLTEEHKRRARQALTRLGEDIPDEATLQARWLTMSPAQQRYMIRRPPPPPAPPRRNTRRGRAPARGSGTPARRQTRRTTTTTTRTRRRR